MEFTLDQWHGLKRHCEDVGLEFISSPFSNQAVDLLEKLELRDIKLVVARLTVSHVGKNYKN